MIPTKTMRAIIFATNIAWFCGAVPYRFADFSVPAQFAPSLTKRRKLFFYTSFALNLFYISFIAFRVFQKVTSKKDVSLDFIVRMGYLFLSYTMTVVLQKHTLKFWEDVPHFLSRYLEFFQSIKASYVLPGKHGPKCLKFFSTMFIIGVLVNLQNIIIIFKRPYAPHFLTSVLSEPLKAPFLYRLPFLLMHIWIWISTWAHIWVFCFHLYSYIGCMAFTIRELDFKQKVPKTKAGFRSPQIVTRTLRSMHVLHRLWQQTHQFWFCPSHKAVAISVGTLASYGVIKLTGPQSIVMGCVATMSLLYLWTLFRKFGQLYDLSEKVLYNWSHCFQTTKWMKKYLRSVPIFRIDVGSFYYVKKTTVINVLWTVLNNTITLLFL